MPPKPFAFSIHRDPPVSLTNHHHGAWKAQHFNRADAFHTAAQRAQYPDYQRPRSAWGAASKQSIPTARGASPSSSRRPRTAQHPVAIVRDYSSPSQQHQGQLPGQWSHFHGNKTNKPAATSQQAGTQQRLGATCSAGRRGMATCPNDKDFVNGDHSSGLQRPPTSHHVRDAMLDDLFGGGGGSGGGGGGESRVQRPCSQASQRPSSAFPYGGNARNRIALIDEIFEGAPQQPQSSRGARDLGEDDEEEYNDDNSGPALTNSYRTTTHRRPTSTAASSEQHGRSDLQSSRAHNSHHRNIFIERERQMIEDAKKYSHDPNYVMNFRGEWVKKAGPMAHQWHAPPPPKPPTPPPPPHWTQQLVSLDLPTVPLPKFLEERPSQFIKPVVVEPDWWVKRGWRVGRH